MVCIFLIALIFSLVPREESHSLYFLKKYTTKQEFKVILIFSVWNFIFPNYFVFWVLMDFYELYIIKFFKA
jgi:hypothetical protein